MDTIGALAAQSPEWFARVFGQRAEAVRLRAIGQDDEPVHTERITKSVSSETTFPDDVGDTGELRRVLDELADGVADSLERKGLRGRTVTVKMRLADFTTFTRQSTLPSPSSEPEPIRELAWRLLSAELTTGRTFRLLGVGVSNFTEPETVRQLSLWEYGEGTCNRKHAGPGRLTPTLTLPLKGEGILSPYLNRSRSPVRSRRWMVAPSIVSKG